MKTFNNYNIFNLIKSKAFLIMSGSLILSSCVIQTGGYSETDGVYYNPNRDTLPEGYVGNYGNQIDNYYDYNDVGLVEQATKNTQLSEGRYGSYESDWGLYTGTETNYSSNNFGWGGMYGMGSHFGWYGGSRWGWGLGFSMGWGSMWGSPWGWNSYYSPWSWGFNNFWGHSYYPYYGGYYGYYGPSYVYGNYSRPNYYRSGANGNRLQGMLRQSTVRNTKATNGFRNDGNIRNNTNNGGFRNPTGGVRPQPTGTNGGFRNVSPSNSTSTPSRTQPSRGFEPSRSTPSNNSGGFRSGSSSSGGFNNSGFRSGGSSSGGGFRSSGGGAMRGR